MGRLSSVRRDRFLWVALTKVKPKHSMSRCFSHSTGVVLRKKEASCSAHVCISARLVGKPGAGWQSEASRRSGKRLRAEAGGSGRDGPGGHGGVSRARQGWSRPAEDQDSIFDILGLQILWREHPL